LKSKVTITYLKFYNNKGTDLETVPYILWVLETVN
jgi:hypothetical protein